ncbi:MAG: iron-containing redox enzyme family protein [Nocardioides sp.]|nr:iron-containing redox enzyme family protein [Nocardioides sp.]
MRLPGPCGPVSGRVVESLQGGRELRPVAIGNEPVLVDRDVQMALWVLYELFYRGFEGVDAGREWDPELITLRGVIERRVERELRSATRGRLNQLLAREEAVGDLILDLVEEDEGPSLSSFLRRDATVEQMRDFLSQRSVQQLKESDPQAFLIPRLTGRAKAALAELQYDEFGGGRASHLHQDMYAETLVSAGLDPRYGAYIDEATAVTLAAANVMSLLALNRRLVPVGVGHFAAFEASSSVPSRRIAAGLERLGLGAAARYFEEHVEADAVHEQIAARDVCGAVVEQTPDLLSEVVFGALCTVHLDRLSADDLLTRWGVAGDESEAAS